MMGAFSLPGFHVLWLADGCATGFVNSSLYTGQIDYQNISGTPSFWLLTMSKCTMSRHARCHQQQSTINLLT